MSTLQEVVDLKLLDQEIEAGNVRRRFHPFEPLAILNYTEQAQYTHAWSETVRRCRGLIYRTDTSEVVARPWAKFFNHGQVEAGELDPTAPVEVTDKMDGSLGILYPLPSQPGQHAVATRGSFESDQAVWASQFWRDMNGDELSLPTDAHTFLFEIVYPGNRIVLDYGNQEDLVLLGTVDTATGQPWGPNDYWADRWTGPRTDVFDHATLADALAQPPRKNAEGLVVRYKQTGHLVKIKQEDYVTLHKLVTGLNARAVWERMGAGESPEQIATQIPDEFHGWLHDVAADLTAQRDGILSAARREHEQIVHDLGGEVDRKAYAAVAGRSEYRPWLFLLLDGRDPSERVWRTLKPAHDYGPRTLPTEDAA